MFNQQQARRPPGAPMQPPPVSQNDIQAKEKLASYVYEYLVHSGASKTAESFKNEVLANTTNAKNATPCETGPGFLQNWWLVFWDLYCAAPERRDGPEGSATLEAKAFHDYGFVPNSFGPPGMMNGMHPQFGGNPSAMGMPPGPDGMMPGHPGAAGFPPGRFPPGRGPPGGPPGGMPPGAPPGAFPMQFDPRMGQRLPPAAMRMPTSFPGMRPGPGAPGAPGGPPGAPQMRPYGAPFMDSPGAAFPPQQMMPNGGMMAGQAPMSMNSPGPNGPMGGGEHDPRFMMMPSSSQAMPFPMDTSSTPGGGAVGTPGSAPPPMGEGGSQLAGMLNGEEMKQSPASTPRGVANGTPGGGGPGSAAPGSVQSGGGGGGGGAAAPPAEGGEDASEISKIKQSIMDDVKLFGGEEMKQDFF